MKAGKLNVILDGFWGSSGKGKFATWLADRFNVTRVSSSNFPNAGHCQTANTVVITEEGMEHLGAVVRSRRAKTVVNMNGEMEEVDSYVPDGVRKVNEVRLSNGVIMECTDEHRYFVWDSVTGKREWVRSMDLDPQTHQFLFPKEISFPSRPLFSGSYRHVEKGNKVKIKTPADEEMFAEYLGLLVGDGYYAGRTKIDLAFHSSQMDVLERVQALYVEMGITNAPVCRVGDKECFVISTGQVSGLFDLLTSVGLKPATGGEKTTPVQVVKSNKAVMGAYLRGLFDADGSAKRDRVTLTNSSESVVRDAQQILYVLGVHSSLSHYDDKPGRGGSDRMRQWVLNVSGQRDLIKFRQVVGFASATKDKRLQSCIDGKEDQGQTIKLPRHVRIAVRHLGLGTGKRGNTKTSYVLQNQNALQAVEAAHELFKTCDHYHVVSIRSVSRAIREEEVFDLTVPGTHSYVANGCVSHNTARFPDGTKFVSKAIPTAAILKRVKGMGMECFLSPGSGFRWDRLAAEWEEAGRPRIHVHGRASVVTDDHARREREGADSTKHIASTMQGSGAAISDKVLRRPDVTLAWDDEEGLRKAFEGRDAGDQVSVVRASQFRELTWNVLDNGQTWLHEGSQGFALSIDHGSHYPYCTSRNCTLQAAMDQMAVPPGAVGDVYLNLRTFPIRVGNVVEDGETVGFSGDFYPDCEPRTWEQIAAGSGMPAAEAAALAERERTTVTKRIRRACTFSFHGLRDAVKVNGATKLILNFVQYVDWADAGLRGEGAAAFSRLSPKTRALIDRIEDAVEVPVVLVGTGADHEDVVVSPHGI